MRPDLCAGVAVRDLPLAVAWSDRLLGDVETFIPNATEQVWTLAERRHRYAVLRPDAAGHAPVTLFVEALDGFLAAAGGRGVQPESRQTDDNGVRKVVFRNADGNEIGVGGHLDQGDD